MIGKTLAHRGRKMRTNTVFRLEIDRSFRVLFSLGIEAADALEAACITTTSKISFFKCVIDPDFLSGIQLAPIYLAVIDFVGISCLIRRESKTILNARLGFASDF